MNKNYLLTHNENCQIIAIYLSGLDFNTSLDWRKIKTDGRDCNHQGCENAYYSRGLCAKHYAQTYRGKGGVK